eukprot:COSAG06_NODE_57381_length_280_cov_1.132597_1_plen_30_part_01
MLERDVVPPSVLQWHDVGGTVHTPIHDHII